MSPSKFSQRQCMDGRTIMEHRWNDTVRVKRNYSEKTFNCHYIHHKSHTEWPRDRKGACAVRGLQT